jgi:hypothetical protein
MQDIKSATLNLNQSLTNAAATTLGVPFCISQLSVSDKYSWAAQPTGTVTTVTMTLMGSLDGVFWYILDTMVQTDTAGANGTGWQTTATANYAAGELRWLANKQVNFLRIDLTVISGGGSVNAQFSTFESDR